MRIRKINRKQITRELFSEIFENEGCILLEEVFPASQMEEIIPELRRAIETEAGNYQEPDHKDYGMLLAAPIYGGKFLEILESKIFFEPFHWLLGETCIIWVYTSSSIPPRKGNYASRIHVDRPHFIPGFLEGAGSLILLDDFTEENGGTWYLPGSHLMPEQPDEEYFYKNAVRLTGKKGSVFYFNLRLWHAGGTNQTDQWRNALGIGMIRPYLKQRIDLPRAMAATDISGLSDFARQKLGFFAQPPSSLEEYYNNAKMIASLQPSEWNKKIND